MIISLIVAMGKNREIGKGNKMMWRLPHEWDYFKKTTLNHCILTGRKNFEAQGRALPKRTNIVVTRNADYQADNIKVVTSLEEGIELARSLGEQELFICGGGEIYRQSLDLCDRLYITEVDFEEEAEVFFPEIDESQYRKSLVQSMDVQEDNQYAWKAYLYEKNP